MPDGREPPRLPWLSSYGRRDQRTRKEKAVEWSLAGAAGVAFLVLIGGVLWLFVRYPFPVFGALVAVWIVGFVTFTVLSRRARARERRLRDGSLFEDIRRARHDQRR
jgi:cobalamin biosynthesis protein CobD/CbiB